MPEGKHGGDQRIGQRRRVLPAEDASEPNQGFHGFVSLGRCYGWRRVYWEFL